MSWSEVFPVLTDEHVEEYELKVTAKERKLYDSWFAVQEVINPREVGHIVSTSLFWKNIRMALPQIVIKDRAMLMNAGKSGKLLRFDPWTHYVEPLLKGAHWLRKSKLDAAFRVYLAADMEFLVPDLVAADCEVRLMKSNSLAHNPGAMWRMLAFEDEGKLVTLVDADRAARPAADIARTEETKRMGLGWWRVPVWGELNEIGNMNYRPMLGCQLGGNQALPIKQLMQALIWHTEHKSIDTICRPPGCKPAPVHGSVWPDYGYDEWFLQTAVFPRAVLDGVLSMIPADAKSRLLPLDVEFVQSANPASELQYFGRTGAGCCGPAEPPANSPAKLPAATEPTRAVIENHLPVVPRKDLIWRVSNEMSNLSSTLRQEVPKAPIEPRLAAFCTVCQNRLEHLKETLPQTLEVVRQGGLALAVVVDYACSQGTAKWVAMTFAQDIERGNLVLVKVPGKRKFQVGTAKAVAHAVACHYAENLFNLDADNFLASEDLRILLRTGQNHRVYIGHQFDGSPDTYGRLFMPTWLYRAVGGYHCKLPFYGGEDVAIIAAVLQQPSAALLPVPMTAALPIRHSDEERIKGYSTHKEGLTKQDHIDLVAQRIGAGKHIPLGATQIELWDARGNGACEVDHFTLTRKPGWLNRLPKTIVNGKPALERVLYWKPSNMDGGLGDRMRGMAGMLVLAEVTGQKLCLPWFKTAGCPGEFSDVLQVDGVVVVRTEQEWQDISRGKVDSTMHINVVPEDLWKRLTDAGLLPKEMTLEKFISAWKRKLQEFRPVADVHQVVENLLVKEERGKLLGLHIRRTDAINNEWRGIVGKQCKELDKEMLQALKLRWKSQNWEKVVLACDDKEVSQQWLQRLRKARIPVVQHNKQWDTTKLRQTSLKDAAVDLFLLSRCGMVLTSVLGSFSWMASVIGDIPLEIASGTQREVAVNVARNPARK